MDYINSNYILRIESNPDFTPATDFIVKKGKPKTWYRKAKPAKIICPPLIILSNNIIIDLPLTPASFKVFNDNFGKKYIIRYTEDSVQVLKKPSLKIILIDKTSKTEYFNSSDEHIKRVIEIKSVNPQILWVKS